MIALNAYTSVSRRNYGPGIGIYGEGQGPYEVLVDPDSIETITFTVVSVGRPGHYFDVTLEDYVTINLTSGESIYITTAESEKVGGPPLTD